jgi:4a-hydroxytetrahydrobiopterin dehydratase
MARLLNSIEIQERLKALPGWQQNGKAIQQTFKFNNFIKAIDFVNRLVKPAEAAGHHPDLEISYNKVTVTMTSHDAGGLTTKDFEMAVTISQLV